MKKLLFIFFVSMSGAAFAVCPAGHVISPNYIWMSNGEPCPAGYVETIDYAFVAPEIPCPPDYAESNDYIAILQCDATRGVCEGNLFVCIVN